MAETVESLRSKIAKIDADLAQYTKQYHEQKIILSKELVSILRQKYQFIYVILAKAEPTNKIHGQRIIYHEACFFSIKEKAQAAINKVNTKGGYRTWNYQIYAKESIDVTDTDLLRIDEIPENFPYESD
jgi:hypothetical protein